MLMEYTENSNKEEQEKINKIKSLAVKNIKELIPRKKSKNY